MSHPRVYLAGAGVALVLTASAFAGVPSNLEQLDFFEKKIRPVLADNCYKCHSAQAEKVKGGLLLDTREGLEKGGESGPVIVAGKPEKSLLLKTMKHEVDDEDMKMPPKKDRLPDEVLADFATWIKMGAPDPRDGKAAAKNSWDAKAYDHWAFKKVANPPVPKPADAKHFIKNPIDAFILAKLQEKKLQPAAQADKRTLIRRVTYDLTGLPPTPEEVDAFLADKSSDAYEKLVDRLLASPRYGERWARHWLDIARYADTNGDRPNGRRQPLLQYAWTYRDYVIESMNNDLPYDKFIVQQIAADKLPDAEKDKKSLRALGFLTVGKNFLGNPNDVIDDQIDVCTKGLMALTGACARCHDHKFDPIPTKDYYSLYGVFNSSTQPEEKPLVDDPEKNPQYKEFQAEVAKVEEEVAKFRERESRRMTAGMLEKAGDYLMMVHDGDRGGNSSDAKKLNNSFRLVARERGLVAELAALWRERLKELANAKDQGPVFEAWFRYAKLDEKKFAEDAKAITEELTAPDAKTHPLIAKALTEHPPASLKDVAAIYTHVFDQLRKEMKLEPFVAGKNGVRAGEKFDMEKTKIELANADLESLRKTIFDDESQLRPSDKNMRGALGVTYSNAEGNLHNKIAVLEMSHPGAPMRAMAIVDKPKPQEPVVFIRGEPGNRGPQVPRQFLQLIAGENRKPFTNGSGRLELAQSIASRDNPLTARVMVNRVWQWHFGQAIVRTVSDFGTRAEPPTHPELLDYLATWFMDNGWSLKKLHKLIVTSATYQMDSRASAQATQVDPTNQWLSHFNIERLDFEEIRDTLLAIGGKLDLTMYGQPVKIADGTRVAKSMYGSDFSLRENANRRTIYGYIDRAALPEMFNTFDFANPDLSTGERVLTTVPQQALFMMNGPFLVQQVKNLLGRNDFPVNGTTEQKIRFLYRIAFQRAPTPQELNLGIEFIGTNESTEEMAKSSASASEKNPPKKNAMAQMQPLNAWERYAQVLLMANELLFVN